MSAKSDVAISADGVPIHFDVEGDGTPALVFVHGWSCDRHYWDGQTAQFARRYTVVRIDLAGHGGSGRDRARWTMPAFGLDVVAVLEKLDLKQAVLIGHSMGGLVIVEVARRLPGVAIGLVGADTWLNLGKSRSQQQVSQAVALFRADFVSATRNFVQDRFPEAADPALVERVAAGMSAAPPNIAIGALEAAWGNDRALQQGLREIKAPKITINASPSPTEDEARNYGIEVMRMTGVGHFVMLDDPATFNRLLDQAVRKCVQASIAR